MTIRSDVYGDITAQEIYQLSRLFGQYLTDAGLATPPTYAEGTFTPTIVGSTTAGVGTYSVQQGNYTRIGNRCLFNLTLVWSATTGTGNMLVGGLPFTSSAGSDTASGAAIGYFADGGAFDSYFARIGSGSAQIIIYTHVHSVGIANLALPASGHIQIAGAYLL